MQPTILREVLRVGGAPHRGAFVRHGGARPAGDVPPPVLLRGQQSSRPCVSRTTPGTRAATRAGRTFPRSAASVLCGLRRYLISVTFARQPAWAVSSQLPIRAG